MFFGFPLNVEVKIRSQIDLDAKKSEVGLLFWVQFVF